MEPIRDAEPDSKGRARIINPVGGRSVLRDGVTGKKILKARETWLAQQAIIQPPLLADPRVAEAQGLLALQALAEEPEVVAAPRLIRTQAPQAPAQAPRRQTGPPTKEEMKLNGKLISRELETAPRELGVDAPIKIINPKTGRAVLRSGATARKIIAEHKKALIATKQTLPRQKGKIQPRRVELKEAQTFNNRRRVVENGVDRHGAFKRQTFEILGKPPGTLDEWAATIAAQIKKTPNFIHTVVVFENEEGDAIRRTIHGTTKRAISDEIDRIGAGIVGTVERIGSDVIEDGYAPVTSNFTLGSLVFTVGGHRRPFTGIKTRLGTRHTHFKLVELAGEAAEGDCLLAVLRSVAKSYGKGIGRIRNATIRDTLHLPEGSLPASPEVIESLANYFKLRVRIITGMAVPDDVDREFIDGRVAGDGKTANRCHTVAEEVVIASGGAPGDPQCDVYLADDHYQYIHHVLEPIRTCPVTGDLLVDGKEFTPRQQKKRVLAQGRVWYNGVKRERKKRGRAVKFIEKIIVYDYETTYDANGDLSAYGLGYLVFDPTHSSDFSGAVDDVVQCYNTGADRHACTRPLLDELAHAPENVRYTLVSFNGVRFDHYLLAAAAHAKGVLSRVFATSQGLRTLHIGRHTTLDLAKLIPGTSLAKACKSFKTKPSKIDGFSHQLPQAAYERGELGQWLTENQEEVSKYLAYDVLSTASLLQLVEPTLFNLTSKRSYGDKSMDTIGGHAWELMKEKCPIPFGVKDEQLDKWIRGGITGGRTQVFRKPGSEPGPRIIEGKQSMVDFASLYPTVMAAVPKAAAVFPKEWKWGAFPITSEPQKTFTYTTGMIGLFEVEIKSQPWPNVIPLRSEDGSLDWEYRGEFKARITHIDIELIRDGGGVVNVIEGMVWPTNVTGSFREFILPLAAKKDEQDVLKAAGLPNNPAMRECYKLLQNSASGKCCQQNYEEVTTLATGSANQLKAMRAMDPDRPITFHPLGGEACLITGFKQKASIYDSIKAKPSILAVLIYSYSRALLYRVCCAGGTILYCDTDSALYREADVAKVRSAFPDLDPTNRKKSLGDLEEELPTHENAVSYLIAPKDYSVFCYKDEKMESPLKPKLRMKGVNQRSDRLVSAEVAAELKKMTVYEQAAEYNEGANSRPLSDPAVMKEFFERRAKQEKLTVLCSQLTRCHREEISLKQRFLIKTV